MSSWPVSGMGERECVRELTDNVARRGILAHKVMRGLYRHPQVAVSSTERPRVGGETGTYPKFGREDGTSRAIDEGAPKLLATLPNDLSEMRGFRVTGVVILGFIRPRFDSTGDGVTVTSSSSKVLYGIDRP